MNRTPRLRSAYPSSPWRSPGKDRPKIQATASRNVSSSPADPQASEHRRKPSGPLIPLSLLDAPTQRCYVVAFYIVLWAWRLVDYSHLVSNETDSPWQWMKWTAMDGVFLYGVPEMRIPWLEWSSTTITLVFLLHAVLNGVLMFRIPIPLETWIVALTRVVYDRELAVSEKRVKPGALLQHSSLITGKQIVHILPEGSAMLNPNQVPLCIDSTHPTVDLPIFINQTEPVGIELLHIDLQTGANDTIQIPTKEARKLKKQADRELKRQDPAEPRLLYFPVKRTGIYRLAKVLDESKLEVQRIPSDTLVVPCPFGQVKTQPVNKCYGDLSNFNFQVAAIPPLKIKYRKTVNDEDSSNVQLTIHPDNLDSPLARFGMSKALMKHGSSQTDLSWTQIQRIDIPVNETLSASGSWRYFLEEIRDGCGNVVNYTRADDTRLRHQGNGLALEQVFQVHQRPKVSFDGCSAQKPLKIAKNEKERLPFWLNPTGKHKTDGLNHMITYSFAPQVEDLGDETPQPIVKTEQIVLKSQDHGPEVSEPGFYRLEAVATDFCSGEVLEPSSCLLFNPPEPDVSVSSETIPHQCEGNSIGIRADLDLIGTPPFELFYSVRRHGEEKATINSLKTENMRSYIEFLPPKAGLYSYEFLEIADSVYKKKRSLSHKQLRLEQAVKPTASAGFTGDPKVQACIDDRATFEISLTGDAPWTLDYDLVHAGKRTKHQEKGVGRSPHTLTTPKLKKGGQYSISLTSVTDASGCKIFLDEEAVVNVRNERPSAAFGQIEGKRNVLILQGKMVELPLRLSGESSWKITISKTKGNETELLERHLTSENSVFQVESDGTYALEGISDRSCPGVVDATSRVFEVEWISRPSLHIIETTSEGSPNGLVKSSVCEGDQDAMELSFTGTPPYHVKYDISRKPRRGQASTSSRVESIGLHAASIRMDTSQAGSYEYKMVELGDQLYEHDQTKFSPVAIYQEVHSLPSAEFANTGKTYSYCKENTMQEETIPIDLQGAPPFSVEIGIRHHSSSKPDVVPIPLIKTNRHNFNIPHRALSLGSHIVSIRKVSDANGCQRTYDLDGPGVRVNVVDVPSISPMEQALDFCVGDRISYTLAGTPPFNIFYTFEGVERKASTSTNSFRRLAERPGNFTITAVSDKTSTDACRARTEFTKTIHELPSVHMSKGRTAQIDIHEGGAAELTFEFGGTPPFEFTYTRSTNSAKGKAPKILETKTETSGELTKTIRVSEEGTYEVVSVRDRFCAVSTQRKRGSSAQLLTFEQ